MKKTTILLCIAMLTGITAYAQKSYVMFESVYITVKSGEEKAFTQAVLDHNKKFHPEGPHNAFLHYVATGQHAGEYVWLMGPCTFSDLDHRPEGDAHTFDWASNVTHHIDHASPTEYWRKNDKLSYTPADTSIHHKMLHIRFWDVKPGEWDTFMVVLQQVQEVFLAKQIPGSWNIYVNQFANGEKRDIAAVASFENWASFDDDDNWAADFESIHGEGSWKKAMETMRMTTDNFVEEIRQVLE